MGAYILSLMVTLDQECAIQKLFTKKKWQFIRIDQTTSDGCSNISGTFTLVGKNGKKDNVAGGVKSKKKSARQLNVTSIVEGCNVNNENEHEISGDIDTASEQEFQALGITVKEEVLSDNDEENFVDNDSDYDADGIGETSGMTQVKRATKRRDDSETCEVDEEEPSVKLETGEISPEDDANILAMLEEMPDVKHISELLTSECPDSDPSSMAIPDIETDANGYVTSLSVYFCKWCNYTFPELEYFKGHKRKGRCFFVCQFCKEKFTFRNFSRYQDHLREHRIQETRKKRISQTSMTFHACTICNNLFTSEAVLKRHIRRHKRTLASDLGEGCSANVASSYGLKKRKMHTCSLCPSKQFHTSGALRCHYVREHGNAFECQKCGRKFGLTRHLREHMATHDSSKKYVCSKCGAALKYKKSLTRHMQSCDGKQKTKGRRRREPGKLTYPCPECEKIFTTRRLVQQHMYTHGQSDKPCPKCGQSYKHYSALSRHVQTCRL